MTEPQRQDRPSTGAADNPLESAEPVVAEPGSAWRSRGALAATVLALLLLWLVAPGVRPAEGGHIGFWSLLPAMATLLIVFVTREVITALLLGIVVAGIISGELNFLSAFLLPAIGSESYALILIVYLWSLGGLIGLWTRTGGARAFAVAAGERIVRGERSARFFGWLVGILFHQGGTISTILAGTTVRPVTDERRISKEELTYIVDSTASPVATVIPFNAFPIYVGGLVAGTTPYFATEAAAREFFFRSIPFNFYGILAVLMTLLFALGVLPFTGRKMGRAIRRARETGALNAPGAQPLASVELTTMQVPSDYRSGLADFVVPIGVLLGVAIIPFMLTGTVRIGEAFGLAVISAFALALIKGMRVSDAMSGFVDGCKGVTVGAIILGLAVTLGFISRQLGTANYIVEQTSAIVQPFLLPAILLGICMVVAFSIGSSWGTYAVVFPLAMPLAYAVQPEPAYVSLCFGAVLGGAVFGDQCSPISDTTILSALACGGDLMDHVTTQLPLALTAAGLAAVAYTIVASVI